MTSFAGRQEVYVSKWFAFQRMMFLLDKDESRPTVDTETLVSIVKNEFNLSVVVLPR